MKKIKWSSNKKKTCPHNNIWSSKNEQQSIPMAKSQNLF